MVGDERNVQRCARACEGAILVFWFLKVCFKEEQTAFATSFYNIEKLILAVSYPQGWDLFFLSLLFFLYSMFLYLLILKKKNTERCSENHGWCSKNHKKKPKGVVKIMICTAHH